MGVDRIIAATRHKIAAAQARGLRQATATGKVSPQLLRFSRINKSVSQRRI